MAEVRYCTASDGVRVAYTERGEGYPFLWIPGWVSNCEIDAQFAEQAGAGPGERLRTIALDKRGTGLSARNLDDYSLEARLRDLDAVVAACELDRFAVGGWSEGGPLAIAYTALHPERVTHLCILGSYAHGAGIGGAPDLQRAVLAVVRAEWGMGAKLLSDLFLDANSVMTGEQFGAYQMAGANARDAHLILEAAIAIDVRDLLAKITAPTLVQHGRDDRVVPFDLGQEIAAGIRGARFISYPGGHVPSAEQLQQLAQGREEFVLGQRVAASPAAARGGVATVLFTDLVGHTEMMRRLGDARGRAVLREHERITRDLLAAHGGAEVKTMGDGFMASFTSVSAAMECAIALQRAFAEPLAAAGEGMKIDVRIGLNAGEPIAEDGDLFGETVILASRIAAKAEAGEILIPEPVRHLLAGKGFVFADRGEVVLKGFEDAMRLYEVHWRG